ncbi:MAG TPA: alkaline phosphatase family protein [Candidatus Hydrogenedentes bacterium]|nr:alkaline phosphatase family protein [Candidatus Hydrogenedentota bacterium]HOL78200.1 alkaline phosphatase family protein [Candidatus Hydrogenedentota bacterium]HPO87215.1 alkaline phosphatase family protein [Candidatus Hydrogenedentota bacterium]
MKKRFSRRDFLRLSSGIVASGALATTTRRARASGKPRIVILGFDGMEPSIVDHMLEKGELPHLQGVRAQGAYQRLRSTLPPQSPVAWSSFATCKEPGNHGIFDFLRRDLRSYMPMPGVGTTQHPQFNPDGTVSRPAQSRNFRQGEPFWVVADRRGIRSKLIHIPFSYPADSLSVGKMLCGEGVPDIRGFTNTFFSLSDSFTSEQLAENISGGVRLPLRFDNDVALVDIAGAPDSRQGPGYYVKVPMEIRIDRTAHTAKITVQGKTFEVKVGGWSDWIEWEFTVTPKFSAKAISRVYAEQIGDSVQLYMSSLQFHPKNPYVTFSEPAGYSAELADRYGLYKTLGWAYDTHALRQNALTEGAFLEDTRRTEDWLERLTLDEMEGDDFDMLIAVWTSTDRVAHMFWRYRDPKHPLYSAEGAKEYWRALEDTYQRMDTIVGHVKERLRDDDLLFVMSDHGFHSFRKGFNVNTWLIRNGYLTVKGQSDAASAFTDKEFLQGFDWSKSRAYSLGLGSIYINQKGREIGGIVSPDEADKLIAEIRAKLLEMVDPETGDKVFSNIYTKKDFGGRVVPDTPDIELGYADGYQSTKVAAKGGVGEHILEPNTDKWSGEHGASDVAISPGILFANRPLVPNVSIRDIGVTALTVFGAEIPQDFQGKPILA